MAITSTTQHVYGKAYGGNAADNYERYFVPAIGAPLATDLVDEARLRPGDRVLDVACGTGIVARLASERVGGDGRVAGADINAGMLAVAHSMTAALRTPIQWYETSAEAMPLPDEAFDVVFCQLGLQFVTDQAAALSEMRRVLAPAGRAYVSTPVPSEFFNVLEQAFADRALPQAAAFVRLVFSLNDPTALARALRTAGFRDAQARIDTKHLHLPEPPEFFRQYVQSTPLAGAMAEGDPRWTELEREVVAGWQPWVEGDGMTYPQQILVATARR